MARIAWLCGETVRKEVQECTSRTVREACIEVCGAEEFPRPVVALLNGMPVLRKDRGWEKAAIGERAVLVFVELPLGGGGGGGKDVLATIAQVLVIVAATVATAYLGGVAGPLVAAGWSTAAASTVGALAGAAIMIGGNLLISAVFGGASRSQQLDDAQTAEAASPTYSINAAGNAARLEQAEGEGFGRMKVTPDYIAQAYSEYEGNDQYGCFVYGVGRGEYAVKALYFGDTVWWRDGEALESGYVTEDGEDYSRDVGTTLPVGGAWTDAIPAVAEGHMARTLRVVVDFPNGYGIKTTTASGTSWDGREATILVQFARMDDDGNLIGDWSKTRTRTAAMADSSAQGSRQRREAEGRLTKTLTVKAPGYARWAVRVRNGSAALSAPSGSVACETMVLKSVASTAASVQVQIVPAGQQVALFADNVHVSEEVSSLDLYATNDAERPADGWEGPYAANEAGTKTNEIRIDYGYSSGLAQYTDKGGLQDYSVSLEAQARRIDDAGNPSGDWIVLGTWTDTACTTTPQRRTRSFRVASGRYQVRMRRTSDSHRDEAPQSLDQAVWIGLRAVLPGSLTYPVQAIAVKIKANNALSQSAGSQFRCIVVRKLPLWDRETRTWSEPQETRSWAAAVSAVCQAPWGGRMSDRQIDLDTLWRIGAELDAKGWNCDCYVDGMYSMWQLLAELCRIVLVIPRLEGAVLSFVRDEPGRAVTYELNASNIVRGSFEVTYNTWSSSSPDDVRLTYLDEAADFQRRDVQAVLPASESRETATLDWIGITNREHAFRVATRYAAVNRWRRVMATCQVEAVGRLLNLGDVVSVNHPRFRNTRAGVLSGWNEGRLELTLEEDFAGASSEDSYVSLVKPDGTVWGPVKTEGVKNGVCLLDADDYASYVRTGGEPWSWLSDGTDSAPTGYALHRSRNFSRRMIVQGVQADDLWHYTVTLVNDAPEVSKYDRLPVPAWNARAQVAAALAAPSGVRLKWAAATGVATVSWSAVRGAAEYEVQHSADGVTWLHDGTTDGTSMAIANASGQQWSGNASADSVRVRVCAVSASLRSPWTEWAGSGSGGGDVWQVFVCCGQSNAVGKGDFESISRSAHGRFYDWHEQSTKYRQLRPLADPVYPAAVNSDTGKPYGGPWCFFADEFFRLTGRKSIILSVGRGSSAVTHLSGNDNDWTTDGENRASREAVLALAAADLKSSGLQTRPGCILWSQGETDANRLASGDISVADYTAGTSAAWTWLRGVLGRPKAPIIVSQTGICRDALSDASVKAAYTAVQAAQTALCDDGENVHMGFTGAKDFFETGGMSDSYHYNRAGYKAMGEALARAAAEALGLV